MNFRKFLAVALLFGFLFSTSCKKSINSNTNNNGNGTPSSGNTIVDSSFDGLSDGDASFIESLPDTTVNLKDIKFGDGESIYDYLLQNDSEILNTYAQGISARAIKAPSTGSLDHKNLTGTMNINDIGYGQKKSFISRMTFFGNFFVNRPFFKKINGQPNGLGYLAASKDYDIPAFPKGDGDQDKVGCLDQKSYGLDCSGLIYQMTTKSHMPEIVPKSNFGVGPITNVSRWTTAFMNTNEYNQLYMIDAGKLAAKDIQLGDLIMWKNLSSGHIGFCAGGWIYESGGHWKEPDCRSNKTNNSGPKLIPLNDDVLKGIDNGIYTVYRIKYHDDGTFTGACTFQISWLALNNLSGTCVADPYFLTDLSPEENYFVDQHQCCLIYSPPINICNSSIKSTWTGETFSIPSGNTLYVDVSFDYLKNCGDNAAIRYDTIISRTCPP